MTVKELLDQHNKVLRAKADLDDINFLYPEDGNPSQYHLRETFYEGAYKRFLAAQKIMKEMMDQATPEVLAEAKRIAQEQRPAEKPEDA